VQKNVYFKLESQNPTGSFKDRGTTVEISHAVDMKAKKVVCASTGNMGASVSAYSARAGLECNIMLPASATGEKIKQIKSYGAHVRRLKGDYTMAMHAAYDHFRGGDAYLVGDYAFRGEGEKTRGMEVADQLGNVEYIITAIGNGTMLSATWRGLREMKYAGLIRKLPKMIGVQAKGCSPVYTAWQARRKIRAVKPKTIAGAIACGDPIDGQLAIDSIRESKGKILAVSDREIINARRALAHEEGIDGEPAAVVPYAALRNIKLPPRKKAVLFICGSGLKDLKHV